MTAEELNLIRSTPELRKQFLTDNLGLIHDVIRRRYRYLVPLPFNLRVGPKFEQAYSYEDAVQDGLFGMDRALQGWDPTKGTFSTYANWWIYQNIQRAEVKRKNRHGKDPESFRGRLKVLADQREKGFLSPEDEQRYQRLKTKLDQVQYIPSVDTPVGENGEATVGDQVTDPQRGVVSQVAGQELSELVRYVMIQRLNSQEIEIMRLRYFRHITLEEVGKMLEPPVSRERVRQIEVVAVKRFKEAWENLPRFLSGFARRELKMSESNGRVDSLLEEERSRLVAQEREAVQMVDDTKMRLLNIRSEIKRIDRFLGHKPKVDTGTHKRQGSHAGSAALRIKVLEMVQKAGKSISPREVYDRIVEEATEESLDTMEIYGRSDTPLVKRVQNAFTQMARPGGPVERVGRGFYKVAEKAST